MADMPRAFVIGHPVGHSRSPLIHRTWLARYGIEGVYERVDIAAEDLFAFVETVRAGEWSGGNVTVPHKEAAFGLVDRRDDAAEAIGAVNTLYLENGILVGANTDAYGFAANLDQRMPDWRSTESALVLGAGGACRAVLYALTRAGVKRIDIVNRTLARATDLAQRFGSHVHAHGWDEADGLVAEADIIVNTTSLGMDGQPPLHLDFSSVRNGTLATDIVYVPLNTPFLEAAAGAGLSTCDGLGMLLHQAAPGFEKWFGRLPTVDAELRSLVIADIEEAEKA